MLRANRDSDERLVARARAGDEHAFERLHARYRADLLAFCRHLTGHREDAEDAVQYTFFVTYREIVGTTRPLELRPWLFTVARNRCSSLLRRRRARPAAGVLEDVAAPAEPPPDELERREELRDLIRDLQALPEQQREALLLSELADLRHAEIAQIIGVSQAKVKALVFQARSSLTTAREARDADCEDIRQELATQSGAALRRRRLRRHVRGCAACSAFEHALGEQRRRIAALVPVAGGSAPLGSGLTSLGVAGSSGGAGTLAGGLTGALMAVGADGALKAAIALVAVAGSGVAVAGVTQNSPDRHAGRPPSADMAGLSPSEAGSAAARPVRVELGPPSRAPTGPAAPTGGAKRKGGGAERTDQPAGRRGSVQPADEDPAPGTAPAPPADDGNGSSRGVAGNGKADEPPGNGGPPPGKVGEGNGGPPPGQVGNGNGGAPPGQARKEDGGLPPGPARPMSGGSPPGQVGKETSAAPPGQVRKEEGVPSPGQVPKPEPVTQVEAAPKGNGSPGPPSGKGPEGDKPPG